MATRGSRLRNSLQIHKTMGLMDILRKPLSPVRPWKGLSLPAAVTNMKSMLSREEKQYLTWLTSEKFEGWGAIVDLGPWLGSSSAALAEGLSRRRSNAKICSFDLFRWEPDYMAPIAKIDLQPGDDFLPVFLQETKDYAPWIDARKQDLMDYRWGGGRIEILFVDAAKSWDLTNAILRGFGAFLEPGRSRVVLQDFRYHETHWLPLIFDSRPDLWKEVEDVDDGHTVTFMPLKPLDGPAGIQTDYSEEAFSLESADRLLRSRIAREEPSKRHWFVRMLYRKYLLDGSAEESQKLRKEVLAHGVSAAEMASIEELESLLVPRGWRVYNAQEFEAAATIAQQSLSLSEKRSVHALTLLGFSLFRMGNKEGARRAMDEVLVKEPHHSSARLFRAELAVAEARYDDAERETLAVISQSVGDEETVDYALKVLSQVWLMDGREEPHLDVFAGLEDRLRMSPSFLSCLAHEQKKAGLALDARRTIERALALAPGQELAARLRSEWNTLANVGEEIADRNAAGCLHRPLIQERSPALIDTNLEALTSEVLARVGEGSFGASEEAILLGSEIHRTLRGALDVHNNRFSRRRFRDLFDAFYGLVAPPAPRLADATIVDLGCGSLNPYGLLFLFLMLGARRGIAIDLDEVYDWSNAVRGLAELAATMLIAPSELVGEYSITAEEVLRNIGSFDLARLDAGDRSGLDPGRLIHRRESVHGLSLATAEVDLLFSNAFFEHIPAVEDAIAELARVTRPGGMGVHVIDCTDHRRYQDSAVHPLQFLTEVHTGPLVYGSNRMRPSEFAALFERYGFEVVTLDAFQCTTVDDELRGRLVEPFQSMPEECLAVTMAKLVVRRT
ncbi:MAG: hypothetical protein QOJ42_3095 [Acidobacteriaceae bacterium]|nr:hypothetical protein [Acidobacteriaceae bacterium]